MDPAYFLDQLSWAELNTLMQYDYYVCKDSWEQARLGAYMTVQVNSKRRLKFQDILEFPWEKEEEDEEHDTSITKEDIQRLKERAEQYLKWQK